MSQITPMYTDGDNKGKPYMETTNKVRRLFVETGFGYKEIASSKGDGISPKHFAVSETGEQIGRIIDEYTPPTPSYKTAELKVSDAPSIIHSTGKASYKIGLRIIFASKVLYNDFIFYSSNTFKYYDEKGSVFLGSLTDSPNVNRAEGGAIYDVKLSLVAVKKSVDDRLEEIKFTDLTESYSIVQLVLSNPTHAFGFVTVSYNGGLASSTIPITDTSASENTILNNFLTVLPADHDFRNYFSMSVSGNVLTFKPKRAEYFSMAVPITVLASDQDIVVSATKVPGDYWAKESIESAAYAGLIVTTDARGNYIYRFRPDDNVLRSEAMTFINRLKKYLERMIRE